MVKNHQELVKACGELNLNVLKDKIEIEYKKYLTSLETIKDEALQWAKEIKEQHQKMVNEKKNSPLPPRTPTLNRPKRKVAAKRLIEAEGKENSIAVGRQARAASQAAASKFYGQFHVPVKLRRPSEKLAAPPKEKKRVRIESATEDTDDDGGSVASVAVSSHDKVDSALHTKNLRSRVNKRIATGSVSESSDEEEAKPKMKTRGPKVQKTSPPNKKGNKKVPKKRKLANKQIDSDSEDTPVPPETTQENVEGSDMATTENSQEETDETPPNQRIKKNAKLIMSREVTIKVEKLSENFILKQVGLAEEEEMDTEPEVPTAESQSEDPEVKSDTDKKPDQTTRRMSSRNKPALENKLLGKTPDLHALTSHMSGKVKERVQAVEQSLQKGYPRLQLNIAESTKSTHKSPIKGLKASENHLDTASSKEASPDPFDEESDEDGHNSSPSNLRKKSDQAHKQPIFASMTNLTMTGTLSKSTVFRDKALTSNKKLFEPKSAVKKRRSKSYDHSFSSRRVSHNSHHTHCCSSQSRPLVGTNTIGRSKIVTGKIFTTVAMKEQAQQQAQEAERKKAEERQLREEKLNEANKKKEEILKTRAEEKKRANDEKKNKAKLIHEQRVKEFEAQQRKKEESARQEKEREELKRQKEKEDRAQKLQELKLKRIEKKKLEDARRAKEEEAKKVKEEEAKKAKEEEAKKAKEEEDEKQKKKAAEFAKQKALLLAKVAKPISELPKHAAVAQVMNSTFTKPNENECKTPKPANPAVSKLAKMDSYEVTPTRDELPPSKPKTDDDYGIDEVTEGDSSDDDEKPKKKVPSWAARLRGNPQLDCADYIRLAVRNNLFGTRVFRPTIQDLFGAGARQMTRRSSAVWNTPPNLHHMTLNASMLVD